VIIFEPYSKLILFFHLLSAIVATASAIHLAMRFTMALRGRKGLFRIKKVHAQILAVSYTFSFVLGAMLYPTFRVRVRHEYFDVDLPWATALFEVKEHYAALALLPVLALYVISSKLDFTQSEDRRYVPLCYVLLSATILALFYNAVAGWYLGTLRSV